MLENLETLLTLSRVGTMLETSTEMRITQSAVSKRIAALEQYFGRELISKKGRRVVLTQHGQRLVSKLEPVLSQIREVFLEEPGHGELSIGVSDAILSSWGPAVFFAIRQRMPDVRFTFHTHRTPVVLDRIRSGEFMVGVCTGSNQLDTDLQSETLMLEPMVIIPSGLRPLRCPWKGTLKVITIEDYSGAWRSFRADVRRLHIQREVSLESFFSVAQMAVAGFGHGLVPIGVAATQKVPAEVLINLGSQGLNRPVRFVARKSTWSVAAVARLYQLLLHSVADVALART
jgi:DNA-binding transcriptional LysR family regulator